MSRVPVANLSNANNPLSILVDTHGAVKGVLLQNVSSVDIFVSDDPTTLQVVSPGTGIPTVGFHFPPDTIGITPFILVIPNFNGKLYARTAGAGGAMEATLYDVCATASAVSASA